MNKIVYACNDKLFDGLYLSILSIVLRTKENIQFYLLTADCTEINPLYSKLTAEHETLIKEMVKSINPKSSFTCIDCRNVYDKFLLNNKNKNARCSIYTIFRLMLDCFDCFTDKTLYLDTDTMCCGDIKTLFNTDIKDNEFIVCHNSKLLRWYQKKDYFNAGVILFNMAKCRETKLLQKTRDLLNSKKVFNADQVALYTCSTKYDFFPQDEYRFNRQDKKIHDGDIVKHFVGSVWSFLPFVKNLKQWNAKDVLKKYPNIFERDYKIYHKMKDKIKADLKNEYYIDVRNLRKTYDTLKAVDNISFKVKKGSLFAFLGVNGAGKSTTINIISSTLMKDSGDVYIDSLDLEKDNSEVKNRIGIVFQNSVLDLNLSVLDNLRIRCKFYNMKKQQVNKAVNRVVKILKLEPILNQDVGKLSGGQKRRVDIARALLHEPQLLILDEPTTGLDPKTRVDVWNLINEIRERTNMTVFLTTHYLEEAEKATYVVIMDKGKIIAEGTPNELKNVYSSDYIISYQKKNKQFEKKIKNQLEYIEDLKAYRIHVKDSDEAKQVLNTYADYIKDFEIIKGNMDDVFLNVTGNK